MKYAVELYYDKITEEKLLHLMQRVADEKISTKLWEWKTRPHITLGCFNDVDETKCTEMLEAFAGRHRVFSAHIGSLGMFTDTRTIFASPIMSRSLYEFHSELHDQMKEFDTKGWEWYLPNIWVPHCAIALTREDAEDSFYKASNLLLHEFQKMSGSFVEIGLVKITFPVEEIAVVKLRPSAGQN